MGGRRDPLTLDEFRDTLVRGVEENERLFKHPDDDWQPVLMLAQPRGSVAVAQLDTRFFASDEAKNALTFEVLPQLIRQTRAQMIGMVLSTWQRSYGKEESAAVKRGLRAGIIPRPSKDPARIEAVMVTVVSREEEAVLMAEIKRTKDAPPTLEPWDTLPEATFEGRFIDPLRIALRGPERGE
jgi:hypothetical protein